MKKIPTLYRRDPSNRLVYNEVTPGCEWVLAGEGIPTMKWDGACCAIIGGQLYRRYDRKRVGYDRETNTRFGAFKDAPEGWIEAQGPTDHGHWPGWVPVTDTPDNKWFMTAMRRHPQPIPDGTYELVGPRIQGNKHRLDRHMLIRHGSTLLKVDPLTWEEILFFLGDDRYVEGIVWHHPDGRMCKIKKRDFGIEW